MADNASGHGESTADVAGVGNAVQAPYNVNFSNSFSIQKSVSGIFARNCKQISIRGAWVERVARLITLGTNGRLSMGTGHLANAADGSVGGVAGTGYLYSLGTNAYLDFESGSEPIGTFDNYLDPTTNLNNVLGLDVRGMASGDTTGMFKASGFKTVTLVDSVVNLLAHKFATVNPSAAAPSQKLSFLVATAAPTEDVSFRPLAGPVTLTNTGNISLNGLTEFTVPQNGLVTLRRIAQVVGSVEWVLVSCTASMGTSVPNDGWYYTAGFKREKSNPSANNSMGWVCVTAGIAGSTAVFKNMPSLAA